MKTHNRLWLAALLAVALTAQISAQVSLADLLAEPGANLADPASRERVVGRMREISELRRQAARERAAQRGLPLRITRPNGAVQEIKDFDGETPIYFTTHNANAAISTGANLVRSSYLADGTGVTIGMWDGGSGRSSHQEFGSRMVVKDGSPSIDHATHVGGTLAAAGVVASAKGMSPAAIVDSYDWNSDTAEMASRGASAPGQAGKIYLSNHSYGFVNGWNYVANGTRTWEWHGNGTTATSFEQDFGRYNTYSRDQDALAFSAPYYLIFRSAGNERTDNPSTGESVALAPGSSTVVAYDPALDPAGDGRFRGGFETIAFEALSKNVITIGSATDAVTSGQRDPSKAFTSTFSSWGPTDDGRIKPDLVANGDGLYSSLNASNTSYGTYSGTSMSSPNAAGSAALLIHHYGKLFPSQAMRASTMKGLLIHTSDDRGNAGPDYKFGWGLMNVKAAADLISDHSAFPEKKRVAENQLTTATITRSHPFLWDGRAPIRATLSWTDPAGTATTTSDLRNPRLINNLNLKIIAPNGSEFFPYVMPFVGNWTEAAMDSAATTGVNNTDNIEQVQIGAPPSTGTYQVIVSFSGTLTNSSQNYSLLINGSSAEPPPPPPLTVSKITPASGLSGTVTVDLTGTGFRADTAVKLARSGQTAISGTSVQLIGESLRCQFNLTGAAAGVWDVVVTNPNLSTSTLAAAFTVVGAIWSENFDGTPLGWTSQATTGTNSWTLTSAASHSPAKSYFAPGPASKTTVRLTSPAINIPQSATDMQLKYWHRHDLQSGKDGGRIEVSTNDGTSWFGVEDIGSGVAFASNGYNTTMGDKGGGPNAPGEFGGLPAWSGSSNGFVETILNLVDASKFTGKTVRFRWVLATNASISSPGWYIDSIVLTGGGDLSNKAPVITSAAAGNSGEFSSDPNTGTSHSIVSSKSIGLTVGASDDSGESALTYIWSAAGPAPAFFLPNSSNAAKSTTATFEATGDYVITVLVKDAAGLASSSSLNVRVVQTASDLRVDPASASVLVSATQAFVASQLDQFGELMASQTSLIVWTTSGGGTINSSGIFTATTAGGPFVIGATSGSFSGNAAVTVLPKPATITLSGLTHTFDGSPKSATATTAPAGLAVSITYNGFTTPPSAIGTYAVEAVITDPNHQGNASGQLQITGMVFSLWQAQQFTSAQILAGEAATNADADRDGLQNLAEYALGEDPNAFTPPPTFSMDANFLTLTFRRPKGLTDVTYHAESSGNITTWSSISLEITGTSANTETIRARAARPAGQQRLFLRLRFDAQSPSLTR